MLPLRVVEGCLDALAAHLDLTLWTTLAGQVSFVGAVWPVAPTHDVRLIARAPLLLPYAPVGAQNGVTAELHEAWSSAAGTSDLDGHEDLAGRNPTALDRRPCGLARLSGWLTSPDHGMSHRGLRSSTVAGWSERRRLAVSSIRGEVTVAGYRVSQR